MQASPMLLPKPVGNVLSTLPAYPGSLLFVTALNLALAKQLGDDVGDMLKGKSLRLCVTDARVAFDFADDPSATLREIGIFVGGRPKPELPPGQRYELKPGAIHNLKADQFVADHGDVTNSAVANALLAAIGRQA